MPHCPSVACVDKIHEDPERDDCAPGIQDHPTPCTNRTHVNTHGTHAQQWSGAARGVHPSPSPRGDSNSPVPWSGVHASAHLHKGVASRGECTGAELVAFAQHPGRVGRSIPTWGPEERRLSPLENSFRWSASASAPRPVQKLPDMTRHVESGTRAGLDVLYLQ